MNKEEFAGIKESQILASNNFVNSSIPLMNSLDTNKSQFTEIDYRKIPRKEKSGLDPSLNKKPLRSMKGIQTMKDFAE